MRFIVNQKTMKSVNLKEIFNKYGLVYVINTDTNNLEDMKKIALQVIDKPMEYEGGANNRNYIDKNIYDVGAPLEAEILFHHEMAYLDKCPSKIAFCVEENTSDCGWTWVSDQVGLTKEILKTNFGKKLKDLGIIYHRTLTHKYGKYSKPIYNHWQDSFNTDSKLDAELIANKQGLVTNWKGNELVTQYSQSAYEYCPYTGNDIMFSSLADHHIWFDTWPTFKNVPPKERPLLMTFGDGSDFNNNEIKFWLELYKKYSFPLRWKKGDVAVLCNYRWAHGRMPIILNKGQERKLGVILGDEIMRTSKLKKLI